MAGAYCRVPRHDGEDDEESGEVRITSQHRQPSFRDLVHGLFTCNIETALVPLPPTWALAATLPGQPNYKDVRLKADQYPIRRPPRPPPPRASRIQAAARERSRCP